MIKNLLLILFVAFLAAGCIDSSEVVVTNFPDGTIETKVTFSNGKKNGLFTNYWENGKVERTGYYKNDGLDGLIVFYDKNGSDTSHTSLYENGELIENIDYMGVPDKKVKTDYKNKRTIVYDKNWNIDSIIPHE